MSSADTCQDTVLPGRDAPGLPVTKEVLEKVIDSHYKTNCSIADTRCEVIGEGKGFMSNMTKVSIQWSTGDARLPDAVVIKKITDEKIRQFPDFEKQFGENPELLKNIHNSEVNAYTFFNLHRPRPVPMPEYIYGEHFKDGNGLLILTFCEGRSTSFNEDNTIQQVEKLFECIANVQAYGLNHSENIEKYFATWMIDIQKKMVNDTDIVKNFEEVKSKHPQEFKNTTVDRFEGYITQTILGINKQLQNQLSYQPVVSFGDMQPNNMLWKIDHKGNATNELSALLDFQGAHLGSCSGDLAAVLMWGMSPEERIQHQDRLVQLYYDVLTAKTHGEVPFTIDTVKAELGEKLIMNAVMYCQFLKSMEVVGPKLGLSKERMTQLRTKVVGIFEQYP